MANTCLDINLNAYSGTSQLQRALEALNAGYAKVDERSAADLVLFAKKYGFYLNYYDLTNSIKGDWQPLMQKDAAVTIAWVADWPGKDYNRFIEYLNSSIKAAATGAIAIQYFKYFFDLVSTLATGIDASLTQLTDDIDFKPYLSVAIRSNLALPLSLLQQYYTAFKAASLVNASFTFKDDMMPVDEVTFIQNLALVNAEWTDIPPATAQTISLTGATVKDNINLIITHNLFTGVLQAFINGVVNIVSQAPQYLDKVMQKYAYHVPHYALYLTFLRLFKTAQDHINTYTQRHLDFYYKTVLQLSNKVATPDNVHLLFELQKNTDAHILRKGTRFKAGKDDKNNDLFYALNDDVVLHQASVQSLKSLYLTKKGGQVLYASPAANSEDGNGAKLLSADGSWLAFGDVNKISQAAIGFAIASNVLYLNEGKRTVKLTFSCNSTNGLTRAHFEGKFNVQFTGKKGLFNPTAFDASGGKLTCTIASSTSFSLSVTIPGNAPAIVPYSAKLHGGNFTVSLPMVQLTMIDYAGYDVIKELIIGAITIDVSVDNVKDLSLQNDDGKINPAKPFKPFGEFPEDGAGFIIGSKEIFQKPLTALGIHTVWQTAPSPTAYADVLALADGEWQSAFEHNIDVNSSTINLTSLAGIPVSPADFSPNEELKVTSVDGFIKLELISTAFNLSTYLSKVQTTLAASTVSAVYDDSTKKTTYSVGNPPVVSPPPTPVIKSLTVSYSAREVLLFDENNSAGFAARNNFFYHLEPFGFREMHPFITTGNLTLAPVFNLDDGIADDDGGELWIGLNNAQGDATYSILLQVADGTANPLENMTKVDWYYMAANNWKKFDNLSVTDDTNNLTRSGIVVLKVPAEAAAGSTRADNNLLWVKLVVDSHTNAICKLIGVTANAAKATFVQDVANKILYTKPAAANAISKFAVPDAAVKKTQQPYTSFGGRVTETDPEFYIRVSERLRHKNRAVTTWDYERLVLQNYPQIHKVKCINHTGLVTKEGSTQQKYSEVLPGHVTVVTVPNLSNQTGANLLRPYTSIGLLTEVQEYLAKLTSPFVKLHVINPQFEEVQFEFSVTFTGTLDPTVFRQQLNDDIEAFLTPWANATGKDITFGGKLKKSVVLNFIEERYYVDYVTCFKMHHIISRTGTVINEALYDVEEALASTARSILVSYYNEITRQKHLISSPANCDCNA